MGGDFIIDGKGIVKFMYPSETSSDRPSVNILINELKVSMTTFNIFTTSHIY